MTVRLLSLAIVLHLATSSLAQRADLVRAPMLHAHNCYPDNGRWADRIDRALATGQSPIAIEQDLVWHVDANGRGRSVVAHDVPATGAEPTVEDHFFRRVAPLMEAALAKPQPETWPLVVLHFDFKTNEPEHHRAIWALLGRYERWLTTTTKAASDSPQPFARGPLLVITENGAGQSVVFNDDVPVGARLRLFGTVPAVTLAQSTSREAQLDAAISTPPATLIPSGPTNYRRWVNFSWAVVERGGAPAAGEWTTADTARLRAITSRAAELGLWVRFYTLNGHPPDGGERWTASYNFGSLDAAAVRWRAAADAGVHFIATDQYAEFARVLARK